MELPAGVDSGTRVPPTIVRGREPGPTLALIAGTHGDEVAPVIALQRVRRELDPARLRGTVLLVHVANLPSFLRRTVYYSPIDGKNLNRVYPGKRDGTVSERIADAITREIIERADYLVDIHAGDGNERSEEHTSELQSRLHLVCRLLLEKKKTKTDPLRDAGLHCAGRYERCRTCTLVASRQPTARYSVPRSQPTAGVRRIPCTQMGTNE